MKRKTLAVSLSAILAASMLFGCGSNSKSGDTKSSSGNGSASAAHLMHPTQAQMLLVQVSSTMETM